MDRRKKPCAQRIKLEGSKIGRLQVDEYFKRPGVDAGFYRCTCECGKVVEVRGQCLRLRKTVSCGCYGREKLKEANFLHGASRTSLHNIWSGMHQRCEDPNHHFWRRYGGRGIKVCLRWRVYLNFVEDMGPPPESDLSIERIDNDGNYEPTNCRWATRRDQANNRVTNKWIEFEGRVQTQAQWERELGLRPGLLWDRFHRGWSVERALTTKARGSSQGEHGAF